MKGVEDWDSPVGKVGKRTGLPVYMAVAMERIYLNSGVKTRVLIVT